MISLGKFKYLWVLISISLLASCSLTGTDEDTQSSQSTEVESSAAQQTDVSSENSSVEESDAQLSNFSDEEIEYARVWLNSDNNQKVEQLKVSLIPKGSLINPDNVDYGIYNQDVIEIRGPQESDGSIVYSVSEKGSGYINIYPIPYDFEAEESTDISQYQNIENHTERAYVEPGDDQSVSQLIDVLNISERDSFITKGAAIDLYEEGVKATSDGEMTGLESEFYSRDYFAIQEDEPDYLMLSFDNQGRGGQDYYVFKGEENKIIIDTYFETYEKDEPDIQWTYDINTQTFTEELSQERESQQQVIDPFTEETAFEYIKAQEGFNDDIGVEFSEFQEDGSLEMTLASEEMKNNGGSGTVDTFVIYPNGNYYSKHE